MRARTALLLSAVVLFAQLFRLPALIDAVSRLPAESVALQYPLAHIVFAPITLMADWLNGGSRAELAGFFAWALIGWLVVRLAVRSGNPSRPTRWRESLYFAALALGLLAFAAWLVYVPRAIARLAVADGDQIVFDIHTHSSASRDGRPGFTVAANARWHERAGFHAAFLTDHNVFGDAHQWRRERAATAVRMLDGEELSLRGLHVIVLGNTERINNEPWNDGWDSTLQLLHSLSDCRLPIADCPSSDCRLPIADCPYLIASLPEYWKHHWGADIGAIVEAGIEGFEIWTTSPKAMEIPDSARREVAGRARLQGNGLFGATDMHGIGHTASVWNVGRIPGWRAMDDSTLAWALIGRFRADPAASHSVVVMRRWLPESKAGSLLAVPFGLLTALRTAPLSHGIALLAWLWLPVVLGLRNRRAPS